MSEVFTDTRNPEYVGMTEVSRRRWEAVNEEVMRLRKELKEAQFELDQLRYRIASLEK